MVIDKISTTSLVVVRADGGVGSFKRDAKDDISSDGWMDGWMAETPATTLFVRGSKESQVQPRSKQE